jgi:hypothetical protein
MSLLPGFWTLPEVSTRSPVSTARSIGTIHQKLCSQVLAKLKPGGRFVLGVPNCVNLRKRLTAPLGSGKWSSIADWYEEPIFRGHVREPDVDDLLYIARDMGLVGVRVKGGNWLGISSPRRSVKIATRLIDYPLRLMPAFCANLYLVGHKPR